MLKKFQPGEGKAKSIDLVNPSVFIPFLPSHDLSEVWPIVWRGVSPPRGLARAKI